MQLRRGDIFYVDRIHTVGSEQQAGRPGIIVSNNKNNEHSPTVEIVYLTTSPKRDLPTHVSIRATGIPSIALCEQIHTVDVHRLGKYCGHITPAEMSAMEESLRISLNLNSACPSVDAQLMADLVTRATEVVARCEALVQIYDSLMSRVVE